MDTQDPQHLHQAILAGNSQLVDKIVEEVVVRDLTAADFQILDDGKEQAIHSVAYERSLYWDVRDNIGHHTEYLGLGGENGVPSNGRKISLEISPLLTISLRM